MTARRSSKRGARRSTGPSRPSHRVRSAQRKNELLLPACLLAALTISAFIFVPLMFGGKPDSAASEAESRKSARNGGRILAEAPADEEGDELAAFRRSRDAARKRGTRPGGLGDGVDAESVLVSANAGNDAEIDDLKDMARKPRAKRAASGKSLDDDIAESLAYLDREGESAGAAGGKGESPKSGATPRTKPRPAKATGPPNLFTLVLTGTLGKSSLIGSDSQSWARLGYFMQHESPRPHYLVYPDGGIPLAVPKGQTEAVKTRGPGPRGDVDQPAYRVVINGASKIGKGISFYGSQLASKFTCTIACRIERLSGGRYIKVNEFRVSEESTPSKIQGTQEKYLRKVYDVTFDKLMRRLRSEAPFR